MIIRALNVLLSLFVVLAVVSELIDAVNNSEDDIHLLMEYPVTLDQELRSNKEPNTSQIRNLHLLVTEPHQTVIEEQESVAQRASSLGSWHWKGQMKMRMGTRGMMRERFRLVRRGQTRKRMRVRARMRTRRRIIMRKAMMGRRMTMGTMTMNNYHYHHDHRHYHYYHHGIRRMRQQMRPMRSSPARRGFKDGFDNTDSLTTEEVAFDQPYADALTGSNCIAKNSPFQSNLGVTFSGNVRALTESEIALLERELVTTYNELTYRQCDGHFRSITSTTLMLPQYADQISTTRTANRQATVGPLVFEGAFFANSAECRGCTVDSGLYSLFTNKQRRKLVVARSSTEEQEDENSRLEERTLRKQQPLDICTCPKDALRDRTTIPSPNALSLGEFVSAYNAALSQYVTTGMLSAVTGVIIMQEYEDSVSVFCRDYDNRQNVANIDMGFAGGNPANLSDNEVFLLSKKFEEIYNELTYFMCDQYFRYIVGLNFLKDAGRFEVTFTCRGCPENNFGRTTTLFMSDQGFLGGGRRHLTNCGHTQYRKTEDRTSNWAQSPQPKQDSTFTLSSRTMPSERFLQQSDPLLRTCLCPAGPDYSNFTPNAPDTTKFLDAYSPEIKALVAEGKITTITDVTSVEEV